VWTSDFVRQSWRFLLVGGANTLATAALMVLLSQVLDTAVAYTLVYALGLAFTTVMTNRYVFSAGWSPSGMVMFPAWYLGVYAVGLVVVSVLEAGPGWDPLLITIATVAVTAPLNFVGGRLIFAPMSRTTQLPAEPARVD